eukprot:TRINITY_DN8922_c0_g1_i1.p1 TRINITY_DN8922_c0_g1~~TRINITY_DN8922_c0_g1_i1.p1  ORF type:complete len:355 (-),score=44.82 TRINITY_DN8922_c0_g1_i1:150-1214(-)
MLWVDKHRPTSLASLDFHTGVSTRLQKLVDSGDLPHLLFYGPSGAGKKTRIMALLREIYGNGVEKMRMEHRVIKVSSSKKVEITSFSSNYHFEFSPSDAGIYDRVVLQEVLKDIAQTQQLDSSSQRAFKVVVINEVDRMTKDAQQSFRRTMEKYAEVCRFVLCCESTTKVLEPLRSRCLSIRIAAPTVEEVCQVLDGVARKEGIQLPERFAQKIAVESGRNLRRAILMLEASHVERYPFTDEQKVQLPDWQRFIQDMAAKILQEQSPKRLMEIRNKTYELLQNCIPPSVILKTLSSELCQLVPADDLLKHEITQVAAFYEHRVQTGAKDIFHIEAFVAKVMAIYKRFLVEMYNM